MAGELMQEPIISVIIPTIHWSTVGRALRSIAMQSPGFTSRTEVFVIYDGKPPVSEPSENQYPFALHVLGLLPRQGAATARNVGLHFARGHYIALLDDDDEWLPNHLARTIPLCEKTQGIVYTDAELYHVQEGWHKPFRFAYHPAMLTQTSPVIPSTMVTLRKTFSDVGFFDIQIPAYSDWDWVLRASRLGLSITRIPEVTANYYFTPDSTSARSQNLIPELRELCHKHHLNKLPVANFAKMITDPWFQRWRIPGS